MSWILALGIILFDVREFGQLTINYIWSIAIFGKRMDSIELLLAIYLLGAYSEYLMYLLQSLFFGYRINRLKSHSKQPIFNIMNGLEYSYHKYFLHCRAWFNDLSSNWSRKPFPWNSVSPAFMTSVVIEEDDFQASMNLTGLKLGSR